MERHLSKAMLPSGFGEYLLLTRRVMAVFAIPAVPSAASNLRFLILHSRILHPAGALREAPIFAFRQFASIRAMPQTAPQSAAVSGAAKEHRERIQRLCPFFPPTLKESPLPSELLHRGTPPTSCSRPRCYPGGFRGGSGGAREKGGSLWAGSGGGVGEGDAAAPGRCAGWGVRLGGGGPGVGCGFRGDAAAAGCWSEG